MNRHVNAIAGRLSLRAPQRHSLEILDRITKIVPPNKAADLAAALEIIRSEYPTVTDFERDFPSLCFALATGVGKTRLMGAFISYLHLAHGINNFFVMAPNLTIYNKLIADFTPNTPKYVFKGIAEFAQEAPEIITGANARILIEQSIGRGLRLPYGKRTGVSAVDRLTIVAHDKFQEIVDEANRPDSQIRLEKIILEPAGQHQRLATVVSQSGVLTQIGGQSLESSSTTITESGAPAAKPIFETEAEQKVAKIAYEVIHRYEQLPRSNQLLQTEIQQAHHWEKASGYDVVVSRGFTSLKQLAFTAPADEAIHNFRHPVADKTKIAQRIFGGFSNCLYPVQKFQSDTERVLSVILDREAAKWFKPGRGQFQIFYKWGADQREYQPDFVAETADAIYMLEPKMRKEMEDGEVVVKKDSAVRWCRHASEHATKNGGKPWKYLLIPHDAIAENMSIKGLTAQFDGESMHRSPEH